MPIIVAQAIIFCMYSISVGYSYLLLHKNDKSVGNHHFMFFLANSSTRSRSGGRVDHRGVGVARRAGDCARAEPERPTGHCSATVRRQSSE